MAKLHNLPVDKAVKFGDLIEVKEHQVASRTLTQDCDVSMTLMAFSEFEDVSEEEYFGDTVYYVLEGRIEITQEETTIPVKAGEVFLVKAHTLHAVGGKQAAKFLQITVKE